MCASYEKWLTNTSLSRKGTSKFARSILFYISIYTLPLLKVRKAAEASRKKKEYHPVISGSAVQLCILNEILISTYIDDEGEREILYLIMTKTRL